MRIRIVALVIAIAMLATVQSATAYDTGEPFAAKGWVHYENGTACPHGWHLWMENLNWDMDGEPWHTTTSFCPPIYDYLKGGSYKTESDYIQVTATSPDGSYSGTNVRMWTDAYNGVNVMINITVYEVLPEIETFTKPLVSGWNLVSLPLTPTDSSTSAVLGNATIAYDAVKSYNAATNQFEDATTMDPGVGYFVHVTTAGDWVYEGTAFTSMNSDLSTGLNCVGWTNETGSALPGALSSIEGSYRYVARWNAGTQSYEVHLPDAPAVFSDFTTMDRGEGYFIAATAGCTLTYP
jgi:hypothetical protein